MKMHSNHNATLFINEWQEGSWSMTTSQLNTINFSLLVKTSWSLRGAVLFIVLIYIAKTKHYHLRTNQPSNLKYSRFAAIYCVFVKYISERVYV